MDSVRVTDSAPDDWKYVSEGGATIVFAYTGTSKTKHFHGRVLRLRKVLISDEDQIKYIDDEEEPDDPMIAFQDSIIANLVPPEYLPDLDVVLLDPQWLYRLEQLRDNDRPAQRRRKDKIDKRRRKGILATDLVGGVNTLAVEIKPKWGFLPTSTHLSKGTAPVKTMTCRFCMHTHLRSMDGDVPTQYCPLDLYSGDEARVRKAIQDLWDGWVASDGSLNNLRLFISGKMLKPSDVRAYYRSNSGLQQLLVPDDALGKDLRDVFTAALLPLILQTPVLATISRLQRTLDALDVEGLSKLYASAALDAKNDLGSSTNPSFDELQDFVASYHSSYCAWDHSKPDPAHIRTYMTAYLLSATFKDCSIIIKVKHGEAASFRAEPIQSISVIDLDLKDMDRLARWTDLDREIVERYKAVDVARRKICEATSNLAVSH
ncbi:inositol-pentakisphosphate 2-kinase [Phlebopus sp. FC_14]|nr:inositol-pentakisphosphate 2-kinase [Phlebopus sp. FC_14]